MAEARRRLDLRKEALGSDHRHELRLQDLERDLSLMPEIVGQMDPRHPALAKLTDDAVATFQRFVQECDAVKNPSLRVRKPRGQSNGPGMDQGARSSRQRKWRACPWAIADNEEAALI